MNHHPTDGELFAMIHEKERKENMTRLKPCPCGKVPERMIITTNRWSEYGQWEYVYGSCCKAWIIEAEMLWEPPGSDEAVQRATRAWNEAVRMPQTNWVNEAYAKLGFERDNMDPGDVETIQKFLGPLNPQ